MADDELKMRNIDCIHFLLSPPACKKGSDCEYRHSYAARRNPRVCRFWLQGNCIHPSCPFRHPPSEVPSAPQASTYVGKKNGPCYFYFNGYCSKGKKCRFLHSLGGDGHKICGEPAPVEAAHSAEERTAAKMVDGQRPLTETASRAIRVPVEAAHSAEGRTVGTMVDEECPPTETVSEAIGGPVEAAHIAATMVDEQRPPTETASKAIRVPVEADHSAGTMVDDRRPSKVTSDGPSPRDSTPQSGEAVGHPLVDSDCLVEMRELASDYARKVAEQYGGGFLEPRRMSQKRKLMPPLGNGVVDVKERPRKCRRTDGLMSLHSIWGISDGKRVEGHLALRYDDEEDVRELERKLSLLLRPAVA